MSTEDGPGIRTTVFFKGCSLKCIWCQNPESISMNPQVHWMESRCIGCKTCIASCPEKALTLQPEGIRIDRALCTNCGICSEACPSTAMELLGKEWGLDELVNEVEKDRVYFEKSGGGITVSGGEPAMQSDFVAAFLKRLKNDGINTAFDTCGCTTQKVLDTILPYSDLVLFDIKEIDPVKHRAFTGASNDSIFKNLIYVYEYMKEHDTPHELWIRTPIIPEATETEENISGIGNFIATNLGNGVARWELCSFNNLCRDKYLRLDLDWFFKESPLLERSRMEELADSARKSGVDQSIVCWSGPTKFEKNDTKNETNKAEPKITKDCSAVI